MNRRWRLISKLSNRGATGLAPLVQAGGRLQVKLLRATGGRVGKKFFGADVVVLETVGRKTGELRSTPLLYVADGDTWAVIASNAGSSKTPLWLLNLRAAGRATVVFGTRRVEVTAREARPEEYDRLFDALVANYPPVAEYPGYTERRIPIVVFEPA